jgi:hypothetical protein
VPLNFPCARQPKAKKKKGGAAAPAPKKEAPKQEAPKKEAVGKKDAAKDFGKDGKAEKKAARAAKQEQVPLDVRDSPRAPCGVMMPVGVVGSRELGGFRWEMRCARDPVARGPPLTHTQHTSGHSM